MEHDVAPHKLVPDNNNDGDNASPLTKSLIDTPTGACIIPSIGVKNGLVIDRYIPTTHILSLLSNN